MVPIGGPGLSDLRAGLVAAAALGSAAPLHHQAFSCWLQAPTNSDLSNLAAVATANLDAGARSFRDVATLGFASLEADYCRAFLDGLDWLGQRTWFPAQRPLTLEADGVAALGLALAISQHELDRPEWFLKLVTRSASSLPLDQITRSLFIVAAHLVEAPGRLDQNEIASEVRVMFAGSAGITATDEIYAQAWEVLRKSTRDVDQEVRGLVQLKAFDLVADHSLPARIGKLEPIDVVRTLLGVSRSMRRWTWESNPRTPKSQAICWDIQNEYHVQNLLYAILAPLFPDLNDEETIPPIGQKNPRIDLTISSIGTVVEAKFLRPGVSMQKMIDEIAQDVGLYGTDPRWRAIVPFIWDDSARTEEHDKLTAGLKQLDKVIGAIVIPRPAKMPRRT